jgi:hypothetical protein
MFFLKPRIKSKTSLYFGLALAIALYYGLISCFHAFSSEYIVQDDVRQGTIWAEQWVDPSLFPGNYFANYALEQWNNAPGVKWLYEIGVLVGIRPMMLAKILPLFLGLLTSVFYFKFCLTVFPSGLCAFLSTVILSQNIWMHSDLSSATPRAFLFPIFAGFLYCLGRKRFGLGLVFTALQTIFYPPLMLVHLCILGLRCLDWSVRPFPLSRHKQPYVWAIASLVVAVLILLPILQREGSYGAMVTRQQMASMTEFTRNGRTPFFINNPLEFWLSGTSGLNAPDYPYAIWVAYFLPFVLKRRTKKMEAADRIDASKIDTTLLVQMGVAAILLFFAAHLLLFRLYWPSRYPYHTFPFIFSIGAGIVLTFWIARVQQWLRGQILANLRRKGLAVLSIGFMTLALALPLVPSIFLGLQGWVQGSSPELYRFVAQQPKDTLIAGLGNEVSNIPAFALRSVLFSQETAIAFHVKLYAQMKLRIVQILVAQYAADPKVLQTAIQTYGIDYWLVDRNAFTPKYLSEKGNAWLLQYQPQTEQARRSLEQGIIPALQPLMASCTVINSSDTVLLESACLLRHIAEVKHSPMTKTNSL